MYTEKIKNNIQPGKLFYIFFTLSTMLKELGLRHAIIEGRTVFANDNQTTATILMVINLCLLSISYGCKCFKVFMHWGFTAIVLAHHWSELSFWPIVIVIYIAAITYSLHLNDRLSKETLTTISRSQI